MNASSKDKHCLLADKGLYESLCECNEHRGGEAFEVAFMGRGTTKDKHEREYEKETYMYANYLSNIWPGIPLRMSLFWFGRMFSAG